MLCYVMLCYAMLLYYAILCYVMVSCQWWTYAMLWLDYTNGLSLSKN